MSLPHPIFIDEMNKILSYDLIVAIVIVVGVPIILGVLSWLWNKKWVPIKQRKGVATDSFGKILKRVIRFNQKEEDANLFPKVTNKFASKLLSLRGIYWILFILGIVLLFSGPKQLDIAWFPLVALFLIMWVRTTNVFQKRHKILMRMFEVAASEFHYGRGAEMNPWNYVNIKKWESLVIPGETVVSYSAAFKAESLMGRESFERHFNGTVTEDNTWIYTWKSAQSAVICEPVSHLPERAMYPGSEKSSWDQFIVGVGSQGEVGFNLSQTPHALICGSTGSGKQNALSTPVLGAKGWTTIGKLKVGDSIFGVDGKPVTVTHLHPILTPAKAFEVTFKNGEKVIVDGEHLWETETRKARVSRFTHNKKESNRTRATFLLPEIAEIVKQELELTSDSDTISIPELAALTKKDASTETFYILAKEVGPAEEVQSIINFNYNAQIVTQLQNVSYVKASEFIELYNARRASLPGKNFPLTRSQFDKFDQLISEVRDSDELTVPSILEYMNTSAKVTSEWLTENAVTTLPAIAMLEDLKVKAEGKYLPFPDKIFSIDNKENVSRKDIADLFGLTSKEVRTVFQGISQKAKSTFTVKENVELVVPEKIVTRKGDKYFTYPKKLILERLLANNEIITYDQQSKREFASVKTTQELFDTLWADDNKGTTHKNHTIRRAKALELPEANLPTAPYAFGAWLGDGSSHRGEICGIDDEIFAHMEELGYEAGLVTYRSYGHKNFRVAKFYKFHSQLKDNGFLAHANHRIRRDGEVKHIPTQFLMSSVEQRRELLRGLLDTDGTVAYSGGIELATSNPRLAEGVKRLVASLGYIPYTRSKQPSYANPVTGENTAKLAYTVAFQAPPEDRLFHLDRKNALHAERFTGDAFENSYADAHLIVDIKEVPPVPMRCLSVDAPDRLFLVSDSLIPTHNSVLQRNLIFHCIQHNDMWRFLGVDVKRVELTPFNKYKETVLGIGANLEDGVEIVRYAKDVMMQRYEEMEEIGVNHFLKLLDENGKPPYAIMLMIDEAFMFMSPEGQRTDEGKVRDQLHGEASTLLGDIARLGRAAGIHLVLATQRPDATVIKGELKANLDIRIAAGRLDSTPSSMVLDSGAATLLPGHIKGRGVIRTGGETEQFQGYFADQDWIDAWLMKPENRHREPSITGAMAHSENESSRLEISEDNIHLTNSIDTEFQEELDSGILDQPLTPLSKEELAGEDIVEEASTTDNALIPKEDLEPDFFTPPVVKTVPKFPSFSPQPTQTPVLPTPTPIVTNTSSFVPQSSVKPVTPESIQADAIEKLAAGSEVEDDDEDLTELGGETDEEYLARIMLPAEEIPTPDEPASSVQEPAVASMPKFPTPTPFPKPQPKPVESETGANGQLDITY
jgi:hypothetical protein